MDVFNTLKTEQYSQNNGLFIESRQLSWVVSGILFALFCMFGVGYQTGKKSTQTYVSSVSKKEEVVEQEPMKSIDEYQVTEGIKRVPSERFYAQLAIYNSRAEAEALVASLQATNIVSYIKELSFSTDTHQEQLWYQVVTEYFDNKSVLEDFVTVVVQQEKLQDVCFISC